LVLTGSKKTSRDSNEQLRHRRTQEGDPPKSRESRGPHFRGKEDFSGQSGKRRGGSLNSCHYRGRNKKCKGKAKVIPIQKRGGGGGSSIHWGIHQYNQEKTDKVEVGNGERHKPQRSTWTEDAKAESPHGIYKSPAGNCLRSRVARNQFRS